MRFIATKKSVFFFGVLKQGRPCAWRGRKRPKEWKTPGPRKGQRCKVRTRFAAALAKAVLSTRGPVALDFDKWASTMQCEPETLRKATMVYRTRAWCFQSKHFFIVLRPSKTIGSHGKGCGRPLQMAISRHRQNTLSAGLRWHWRQFRAMDWHRYTLWLKKLAFSLIYRGKKKSDGKHKGFSPATSRVSAASALDPPALNRRAWGRYGRIAGEINAACAALPGVPPMNIKSWVVHRLQEQHGRTAIVEKFKHALSVLEKRTCPIENKVGWLCGVAAWHLNSDGLVPTQRRRAGWSSLRTEGPTGPTFKEDVRPQSSAVFIDREGRTWMHVSGNYWKPI